MIRKKKLYEKPKKAFQASRISEENELIKRYALKNKREIWKTQSKINYFRGRAKALARAPIDEQEVLFNKLKSLGLNTSTIADVLDLKVENLLDRRLPTIISKQKIANSPRHARQLVVHKKILVNGKVVNSPSYIVPVDKEKAIRIKDKGKKKTAESSGEKTQKKSHEDKKEPLIQSENNPDTKTINEIKEVENNGGTNG